MPAFRPTRPRCRLAKDQAAVVVGGWVPVVYDVASYDDVGGWNGTDQYICDRPGLYQVLHRVGWEAVASASRPRIGVSVNGLLVAENEATSTAGHTALQMSDAFELEGGDVVQGMSHRHPTLGNTIWAPDTVFVIVRIGPKSWR